MHSPAPVAPRTVALTFDDGPSPSATPAVLDILARNHLHATFFVVGERAARFPDLVRRIVADGDLVGNHSWNHPLPHHGGEFDRLPAAQIIAQIDRTSAEIAALTGRPPCLFRAPGGYDHGAVLQQVTRQRRLSVVYWTYDPKDWAAPRTLSPDYQRLIVARATGTAPHAIVLMHDGSYTDFRGNTVAGLQRVIDYYRSHGYVFTDPLGRTI